MSCLGGKLSNPIPIALLFATLAVAQSTCSTPAGSQVFIRNEGVTEQIGDLGFTCAGSGGTATIQVFISPAISITSAVLSLSSASPPIYTEALAITGTGQVQGVVDASGTSITFSGVPIPATVGPATTPVTITNIRVNATSIPAQSGFPPSISETVFVSGLNVSPAVLAATPVAYVVTGLGPQSVTGVSTSTSAFGSPSTGAQPTSLVGCSTLLPALPAFFVKFGESLGSAFKQRGSAGTNNILLAWAGMNTETGYVPAVWPNTPGASNIANSATRIKIVLTNVPQNAIVYFPTSPVTDTPGLGTLALTGSETGPLAPFSPTTPDATNNLPSGVGAPGLASVGNSGGTVEAVYEVTAQSPAVETYSIPVYFAWAGNTVVGNNTPIGVSVSFAPTGAPANVPDFAIGASTTPLTGSSVNACFTSLLFPFVTNESGFDTAIVISNTSTDPFAANGATAQTGTCNLSFYGLGTPTPSTNVLAPSGNGAGGAYASGQTYAFMLSEIAVGFQGYLIAACNFQFAHGFASITTSFGQPNGTAMGYVPLVLAGRGLGTTIDSAGN